VTTDGRAELQRIARLVEVNRQRLEELDRRRAEVLQVVEDHRRTAAVLESLIEGASSGRAAGHVGIGAGVSLPLSSVASEDEGRTIVDLGSGVYGERTWSGALEITIERQQELEDVAGRIATSMKEVEATVAQHATAFNALAEQIEQAKAPTPAPQPNAPQPPESVDDEGEEPHLRARSVRRRFGSELTLDD
jgi:prefoldin subunit 5